MKVSSIQTLKNKFNNLKHQSILKNVNSLIFLPIPFGLGLGFFYKFSTVFLFLNYQAGSLSNIGRICVSPTLMLSSSPSKSRYEIIAHQCNELSNPSQLIRTIQLKYNLYSLQKLYFLYFFSCIQSLIE